MLLVRPNYFSIEYAINPFMQRSAPVNKDLALQQWEAFRTVLVNAGKNVKVLGGLPGLPDLCFCANQVFPFIKNGKKYLLPGTMANAQRADEVPYLVKNLKALADEVLDPLHSAFETNGDAIWNYETSELFIGIGPRTTATSARAVAALLPNPVFELPLAHPDFYHLDTCLCVLNANSCLYVEEAFFPEGLALIRQKFPTAIRVPIEEASQFLAANAVALDGNAVIIDEGAVKTIASLRANNFTVTPLSSSEFIKSGGSFFCLKQFLWD